MDLPKTECGNKHVIVYIPGCTHEMAHSGSHARLEDFSNSPNPSRGDYICPWIA